jgi:hypothetical protein
LISAPLDDEGFALRMDRVQFALGFAAGMMQSHVIFSDETLNQLADRSATVRMRSRAVVESYLKLTYRSALGAEYAQHGYSRRMSTLARCVNRVFRLLPPEEEGLPDGENLTDAVINIQTFVFNTFGALDNLANIWINERGVTKTNGLALSPSQIGLGDKCELVRHSFSSR